MSESDRIREMRNTFKGKKTKSKGITHNEQKRIINKFVRPNKLTKVNYKKIHYLFKNPDKSVSLKYENNVRYKISCK